MTLLAIILVPSQGDHVKQFYWSAHALKKQIYNSRAEIIKAEVGAAPTLYSGMVGADDRPLRLLTERGKSFSFSGARSIRSVITISHSGAKSGPNLLFGAGGHQPWQVYGKSPVDNPYSAGGRFNVTMMRPKAREFWSEVGGAIAPDGKIIMLGCNLGTNAYIDLVANASGRKVYGPTDACAAADAKLMVGIVRRIENNTVGPPMRESRPGNLLPRSAPLD